MYDLINANSGTVLQSIDPKTVSGYYWLVQNLPQVATQQFQNKYAKYWGMQYPNQAYRKVYFQTLQASILNPPSLSVLTKSLYNTPVNKKGQSNQFSFATKLLHMADRHSPIYDLRVAAFYFFAEPDTQRRVAACLAFHAFLVKEYGRVLNQGLLTQTIQAFRQQFPKEEQNFTDERIIDVLIWAYVGLLQKGVLISGQIAYR